VTGIQYRDLFSVYSMMEKGIDRNCFRYRQVELAAAQHLLKSLFLRDNRL
jgi:hypothetical protein